MLGGVMNFFGSHVLEQLEFLLRLILACIWGMGIGFERKNRNKIAGVRIHAIVVFGSALMMIVSKYGFEDLGGRMRLELRHRLSVGLDFWAQG